SALRDLTEGLRQAYTGGIAAARAMDGIRNYFIPADGNEKQGWALMRQARHASGYYVKTITEQSKGPRHADWFATEEQAAKDGTKRAWILMNRFLEYRKRNNQQLSLSEFPLLDLTQT